MGERALTEVSMQRQRGCAVGGTGNLRMQGSSRSSASYSAITCRRYCFLEQGASGGSALCCGASLQGVEGRGHGTRSYSRGFDGPAQTPGLNLFWGLGVHKEGSWGWRTHSATLLPVPPQEEPACQPALLDSYLALPGGGTGAGRSAQPPCLAHHVNLVRLGPVLSLPRSFKKKK